VRTKAARVTILAAVLASLAVGAALIVRARRLGASTGSAAYASLEREHQRLHQQLESLLDREPLLTELGAKEGEVVLAVRSSFARSLIQEVARLYLDRVGIDLQQIRVDKEGKLTTDTPIGRRKVGTWSITLDVHRVQGVLRAGAAKVQIKDRNRLGVVLPVRIEKGRGEATLGFNWDPHWLVSLVCRDFETAVPIAGRIVPREYEVQGEFAFAAAGRNLIAHPRFEEREFRLEVDPSVESWDRVRRALDQQNEPSRCGLAMHPDEVVQHLREIVAKGFDVKLPRKLYRPVRFPAGFSESVTVDDRPVDLAIQPRELRMTSELITYAASVRTRVGESTQ
jgi:hypothetical protein